VCASASRIPYCTGGNTSHDKHIKHETLQYKRFRDPGRK